ncbi:MAG TPA: HAMP domain-containing sensor histidine kinase [Bryobacteraceae bacterium]|nr:HAMP domain-containing sensor histidine kinase [Bryobacteraceae bacterium]
MKRLGQTRLEWALLAVIAVVCAVLSFLQYRWTGELSRAEPALLRAGLNEQVGRLVRNFNEEIRESSAALLPDAAEVRAKGTAEAHKARYEQWAGAHDRALFSRLDVAVPKQGAVQLYRMDAGGNLTAEEWPEGWGHLREEMTERSRGQGRPPAMPPDSNLIELPVFANPDDRGSELEWMLFELDQNYVRSKILPRLVAEYLNPGNELVYDASVSWGGPHNAVIYSTRADQSDVAEKADATAGMFSPETEAAGRGRGRFHEERRMSRWVIAVRHRAGSLDAAVARARRRNLIASLLLVGLLGGVAWALVRYTARSRRLAEMQFRFAAGVSHDLRTPLTAIRGAAYNMAEGLVKEPAAVNRYAKLIQRNAEELTAMIENVLAFSATLQSKTEQSRKVLAVGELLQHAAAAMTPEAEQAGCRLEVNVAPDLPTVRGDSVALELVFRNLIGNAARHGAQGKWIGVSAARAGDGVEVRVCDRGPGIAEAERERIFEPFYRGKVSRAQRVQGTGLGLSLAKNTVEQYKGTVEAHNSPGGGAEFTVRLPAASELS